MSTDKITVKYLKWRIEKAKTTKERLETDKRVRRMMSTKNLIRYCEETTTICEALLKKM